MLESLEFLPVMQRLLPSVFLVLEAEMLLLLQGKAASRLASALPGDCRKDVIADLLQIYCGAESRQEFQVGVCVFM